MIGPRRAPPLLLAAALLPTAAAPQTPLERARDLHRQGRLEEALVLYLEAADGEPADAAAALNNACVIETRRGSYPRAVDLCRRALALRREIDDLRGASRTLNNLGLALQSLGSHREAEERFLEAAEINRRRGDAEAETINRANLAALATVEGRFALALERQAAVVELADRHADEPWAAAQRRIARVNRGVLFEKMGAYRQALDLYRGVLADGEALDEGQRATLEVNVGVVLRNLGDPVRAAEIFRRSAATFERLGDGSGRANALLNLGLALHLGLERLDEAEAAYRRALELAVDGGDRTEETRALFHLGRLLLEARRWDEAEQAFERCLALATVSGSAEGSWSALEGRARVARARGEPERALEDFERALDEVESAAAGVVSGELRSAHFGDQRALYGATLATIADLDRGRPGAGYAERALEVVQRAKSRALLAALRAEGGGEAGAPGLAPLAAAAIRGHLGEGTLLEYFFAEGRLLLLRVDARSVRLLDLGPGSEIGERLDALRRDLERGRQPAAAGLAELGRRLLGAALGPDPPAARTWIAADGPLAHLPFELLPLPGADGALLLDPPATVYLPSASALGRGTSRPSGALAVAGFGAPDLGAPEGAETSLPPLAASERELASLGRLLSGRTAIHTGRRATERAVREAAARGARVLHFATHTVVDDRPGRGASILLTADGEDDGRLRPGEIAGLELGGALVVLAACRSADPTAPSGDALATLTGSFLAAGASAVVATLWDVGDETAAAFIEQLYSRLGAGLAPAEALRQAKRRLRDDPRWNRPSIWAAWVLVGDAPPVAAPRPVPAWAWTAAALLAAAAVLTALRRRAS